MLEFVDIDDEGGAEILKAVQQEVTFPLSAADMNFIEALKEKVVATGAAGLAAPQVAYRKQIIAFNVTEEALVWRADITELVPLSVLINPRYEVLEASELLADWEGCFSSKNYYGNVWRANAIRYEGFDVSGNAVSGIAKGFLARLLQHEIDHIHGKLCLDRYDPKLPSGDPESLVPQRKEALEQRKTQLGIAPKGKFPFAQ